MATGAAQTGHIREITVPADEGQLGRVRDFIVEVCGDAGLGPRETSNTKLAVDEACTNIIKHAYDGEAGAGEIKVRVEASAGEVTITLQDRGKRFDFSSIEDPDLDQYVETGRKGGLGVFLINRLMDDVHYESSGAGNQLILTKRAQSGISHIALAQQPFRSTLRFKFTMRASAGLFLLMAVLWGFVFVRQTSDIDAQRAGRWVENRRLAENLASRSVDALLAPDEFSVERTNMHAYMTKVLGGREELAYLRLADSGGQIVSSGNIEEIFSDYREPVGEVLLDDGRMVWKRTVVDGREVRDIGVGVEMTNPENGQVARLGFVHVGVFDDAVDASIEDTRFATTLLLLAVFLVGILLIIGLVQVFVKPIQMLTDGVRAIGDGNLEGKLDVEGPAEIGAIAAVFNEITDKFKVAQDSILEQEKMQKEMEVAKEIQHSLLPRRKPEVSGYDIAPLYQAAAEVGGDYYDFVEVDEDTIGVVVADVSGKGVPGSLVMTMIRTALRMEARGNKNASDVMAKMNAFVTDDMKKGMFVTMFYVIVDSKNRTISYSSAGHNPMVLFRAETNETYFLNPKGFPVGISLPDEELFRKSISLEKIKLKKDDMLLIYTDGVTEAMNAQRDQYGEERMLAAIKRWGRLTPEEFIDKLEGDIKKFTAGHPQNDDITVVAIKEKLQADDVLFGIRRKLIDLVDAQGLSVKEACRQMRVSPATYYRYKKRLEVMGERGLKNKVLRKDVTINRLSLEARKEILGFIVENPDFGSKKLADEYNASRPENHHVTERMVYEELRRLNLNTRELRLEYLRRNRLIEYEGEEVEIQRGSRELVEDLLKDIPGVEIEPGVTPPPPEPPLAPAFPGMPPSGSSARSDLDDVLDLDAGGEDAGVGLYADSLGEVTELRVEGHVDSVTSSALEQRLKGLIEGGARKIVVDLSNVTYISSGGWGIFTGEVKQLRESGGDVVLVGMTAEVFDVYELLGFADVIRAFRTTTEARGFFDTPVEERYATPAAPAAAPAVAPELEEELPGESYVPEWESLKIEATTVGDAGDIVVVSLRGIIDTVSAENLRGALGRIVGRGINKVVVDMSGVEYVSSGGWGTFTERLREVRREGGDIKLFGMDPDVYYVFTMLGFNIVLSSFDILTEAIEDFKNAAPTRTDPTVPELVADDEESEREDEPVAETAEGAPATEPTDLDEPEPFVVDTPMETIEQDIIDELEGLEATEPVVFDEPEPIEPDLLDEPEPFVADAPTEAAEPDLIDEPEEPEATEHIVFDEPEPIEPDVIDEPEPIEPVAVDESDELETTESVGIDEPEEPEATEPVVFDEPEEIEPDVIDEPEPIEPVAVDESDEYETTETFIDELEPEPVDLDLPVESEEPEPISPDSSALERSSVQPEPKAETPPPVRVDGRDVEGVVTWELVDDTIAVARLEGAIEAVAVDKLSGALEAVLESRPCAVVFDFRDVPYVSSTGWGQVASCYESCHRWGGLVVLFGLNPDLYDIYNCLELHVLAVAYATEAEALRAARSGAEEALRGRTAEMLSDSSAGAGVGAVGAGPDAPRQIENLFEEQEAEIKDIEEIGAVEAVEEPAVDAPEDSPPHRAEGPVAPPPEEPAVSVDDVLAEADDEVPTVEAPHLEPLSEPEARAEWSPLDEPIHGDHVDMESAVVDKNIDRDQKLRKMGWSEYGERLRRIQEREGKGSKPTDEED